MFYCLAHITIENESQRLELRSLVELEIELTWRNLTNTARLKLPRKVYFEQGVEGVLKRGSKITIRVGYGDRTTERLVERFRGYVAYVSNEVPLLVECEDEMFMLKQRSIQPKRFSKASLRDVLSYCGISDYEPLGDYQLGIFDITEKETNVAKVLEKLASPYGIMCWYRNGRLHCGNPMSSAKRKPVVFAIGHNIEKSELQYRRKDKDEIRLMVIAISNKNDGKKLRVEIGDNDGEKRTLNFADLSKQELEKQAREAMDKLKYDGCRGSFTAWAEPVVHEGDVVELIDPDYPERNGKFWTEKLNITAGSGGIRQKIELGAAI